MRTLALCFVGLAVGCQFFGGGERGSGKPKTETREVGAFNRLALEGALHADITVGGTQLVEISGDDNLVPLVKTEVTEQRLRIWPREHVQPKLELKARITTPALAALSVSGSTEVKLTGVTGDAFDVDTSGSAKIVASGSAHKLTLKLSGSAQIDAAALAAEDVTVSITGSADVDVAATGLLDVQISGSGHVRYHGTPREVRKSVSGSGTIEQK